MSSFRDRDAVRGDGGAPGRAPHLLGLVLVTSALHLWTGAAGAASSPSAAADGRAHPPLAGLENAVAAAPDSLAAPGDDIARRAVLAGRAARHLDRILDLDASHWGGRYSRGMTHLLWPRAARHSQLAVDDFERLVAIQETEAVRPYFVRAYIGLGDALTVNLELQTARDAWRAGRDRFPADPELGKRLAMGVKEAEPFVLGLYGLDRPFDTDLSFLWSQ